MITEQQLSALKAVAVMRELFVAVGTAFILRGRGGGRAGSGAAQGTLQEEIANPWTRPEGVHSTGALLVTRIWTREHVRE